MNRYLLTDEAKEDLADLKAYMKREAGPRIAKSIFQATALPENTDRHYRKLYG